MRIPFLIAAMLGLAGGAAVADAPANKMPFQAFKLVQTRNIFDPDRRPMIPDRPAAPAPPPAAAPDFVGLTGTLVTGDKAYAFFTGSRPEFKAVLALSGTVANMQVTQITPEQVEVKRDGKAIVIAVGQQLPLNGSTPVAMAPPVDAQPTPGAPVVPTGLPAAQQELIRRMMERRQRETAQ